MSDWIVIRPMRPGTCPACGARHRAETPHDVRSLGYKLRFYREAGRLPTRKDACAHCGERVKRAMDALAKGDVAEH